MVPIYWQVEQSRTPDGRTVWKGEVRFGMEGPLTGKSLSGAMSLGWSPMEAIHKAASLAVQLGAGNPIIAALMPPGTALAIQMIRDVALGHQNGTLPQVLAHYGATDLNSPTYHAAARLVHALAKLQQQPAPQPPQPHPAAALWQQPYN